MNETYFIHKELLKIPVARAAYSDRTAWLMSEMCNLAYLSFESDETDLRTFLKDAEFDLIKTFDGEGTQAFLAKRESDSMLVLAFRGTQADDYRDVVADLNCRFYKDKNGAKIHDGFNRAFQAVSTDIDQAIKPFNKYSFYITGHSLGGALALIATRRFNSDNLAACYTFGSPQVGTSEFGDEIKSPIYRIVNALDPVPFLPTPIVLQLLIFIFAFIPKLKTLVKLSEGYTHHGDMRYLTPCKEDMSDLRLISNFDEYSRFFSYIRSDYKKRKVDYSDHGIDFYCKKLETYALKRLNTK